MSEDWQAGDEALCVKAGEIELSDGSIAVGEGLVVGRNYHVSRVGLNYLGDPVLFLDEIDHRGGLGRLAIRFVKATPRAADEFDREVIADMARQPVGEPV